MPYPEKIPTNGCYACTVQQSAKNIAKELRWVVYRCPEPTCRGWFVEKPKEKAA